MRRLTDREFFDRHLRSFVPPGAFDTHAHLYTAGNRPPTFPCGQSGGAVGRPEYDRGVAAYMGDRRPAGGLFFPLPRPATDVPAENAHLAAEVRDRSDSRALMLVRPGDDPAAVEASIHAHGFAGFKVYHLYAPGPDTFEADPGDFLPPWVWELAGRYGLVVTLHLVKARALADPANQRHIQENCRSHPAAKLVLAHAARGFCGRHTTEGIASLRGLDNVWFDTSVVCEPEPLEAVLREFGPGRLMFGTDFPIDTLPGRCVSVGDGFVWLFADTLDWSKERFADLRPVGIEALLALKQACHTMRLGDADIERVFGGTARGLLGVTA